jgi:tRNA modification GTPase
MGFATDDTIVAIATPPGRGGIGVVRVSGPHACRIAAHLTQASDFEPRHATLVTVGGATLNDQAIVTYFPRPASYTGEDVIEISAHGSPVVLRGIVRAAIDAGARLAEPGEFTLRAYLHGRLDLVQAEAVGDLIDAVTPLQARAAFDQLDGTLTTRIRELDEALFDISARLEASLDFPEEGYHFVEPGQLSSEIMAIASRVDALLHQAKRGRLVREGARVAIVGRPNAGKSTLFNALAGAGRAIVTDIPGTTRDLVTDLIDLDGVPVTLVDTAGLRGEAADAVEHEGMQRTRGVVAVADLLLVVLDRSRAFDAGDRTILAETASRPRLLVVSKTDLPNAWVTALPDAMQVSGTDGTGLAELRTRMLDELSERDAPSDAPAVTNLRHVALLERAHEALRRATEAAAQEAPEEFVAADVTEARDALEEITGRRTADDTLTAIFSRFCIGK